MKTSDMRLRVVLLAGCLGVATLATIAPVGASSSLLLVANKGNQTLVTVDPATLKVTGSYPSGPDPHEVLASPDGRLAFISNYSLANTISVIDLVARRALPPIELGVLLRPHGLAFEGGEAVLHGRGSEGRRSLRSRRRKS